MTRKAGQDSGATKQRLLDVAVEHFAEKGYEGVSLRSVCADADVTTGALYFFFRNKEDLFRQVIAPLTSDLIAKSRELCEREWEELASQGDGDRDVIAQMSHEYIGVCLGREKIMKIIRHNRDIDPVKEFVSDLYEIGSAQMRKRLEAQGCSETSMRVICSASTELFLEVILGGGTKEETEEGIADVVRFLRGGAQALVMLQA